MIHASPSGGVFPRHVFRSSGTFSATGTGREVITRAYLPEVEADIEQVMRERPGTDFHEVRPR
jgi:hypothetical protein